MPEHEIVLDFGAGRDVALVAVEEVVLLRQQHRLQDRLVVLFVELAVKLLVVVVDDDVGGHDVGVAPRLAAAGALDLSLRSLVPHPAFEIEAIVILVTFSETRGVKIQLFIGSKSGSGITKKLKI